MVAKILSAFDLSKNTRPSVNEARKDDARAIERMRDEPGPHDNSGRHKAHLRTTRDVTRNTRPSGRNASSSPSPNARAEYNSSMLKRSVPDEVRHPCQTPRHQSDV